jgi:hypothetical protein
MKAGYWVAAFYAPNFSLRLSHCGKEPEGWYGGWLEAWQVPHTHDACAWYVSQAPCVWACQLTLRRAARALHDWAFTGTGNLDTLLPTKLAPIRVAILRVALALSRRLHARLAHVLLRMWAPPGCTGPTP